MLIQIVIALLAKQIPKPSVLCFPLTSKSFQTYSVGSLFRKQKSSLSEGLAIGSVIVFSCPSLHLQTVDLPCQH